MDVSTQMIGLSNSLKQQDRSEKNAKRIEKIEGLLNVDLS